MTAPQNVVQLLDNAVALGAGRTAIVTPDEAVTYGELRERVQELVRVLRAAGVKPGERVALALPNGPGFATAFFATAAMGAIVTPVHVKLLANEMGSYLTDCGARLILADRRAEGATTEMAARGFGPFEVIWRNREGRFEYDPTKPSLVDPPTVESTMGAISMHSTGSTGKPKRITRTHAAVIGEAQSYTSCMQLGSNDNFLSASPWFHGYGLEGGVMGAIAVGAKLVTREEFFARDALELIKSQRISIFLGVPFMFDLLSKLPDVGSLNSSGLRYCISSGAPLSAETARQFLERTGLTVRQLYGATETGIVTVDHAPAADSQSVGGPIPGVEILVLDDNDVPVPVGVEGNVTLRSRWAAPGYDPGVPASASGFRGTGFQPGDIGRVDAGGRLTLVGRKSFFINVAGTKVDPTEVEACLLKHPAVAEAVVVGVPAESSGELVKAVLVTRGECDRAEIAAYCRSRLAEFKRPRVIEFRDAIPKSPVGKILRKYLIDPHPSPQAAPRAAGGE